MELTFEWKVSERMNRKYCGRVCNLSSITNQQISVGPAKRSRLKKEYSPDIDPGFSASSFVRVQRSQGLCLASIPCQLFCQVFSLSCGVAHVSTLACGFAVSVYGILCDSHDSTSSTDLWLLQGIHWATDAIFSRFLLRNLKHLHMPHCTITPSWNCLLTSLSSIKLKLPWGQRLYLAPFGTPNS